VRIKVEDALVALAEFTHLSNFDAIVKENREMAAIAQLRTRCIIDDDL
jgi:hypothetical protein